MATPNTGQRTQSGFGQAANEAKAKVQDTASSLADKAKDAGTVLESSQSPERQVPDYLDVDHSKMTAKLTRIPTLSDVPYPVIMEPNLVIEFYSR